MRAFERQEGESSKAYSAFCVYRDLGPQRSLVLASESYYGSTANLAQIGVWSSKFDWVDRVRSYDDWQEMIGRQAIQEHLESKAEDFAARQVRIREGLMEAAELSIGQVKKMLDWPLSRQTVTNDDGVTYVFEPAGWSKATAVQLANLAASALTGTWASNDPTDADLITNVDNLTDEELDDYVRLAEKLMGG